MARVWLTGLGTGAPETALVFPGPKRVGLDNLGFHAVFRALNRAGFTEIFFGDSTRGLRTGKELFQFPVIFFSFSYEPDYLNGLRLLSRAGIELNRKHRPLHTIIAGGIAPSANPYPLWHSFDAVLIGESEAIFPELLPLLDLPKEELLQQLQTKSWAWVPERKETGTRAWIPDLSETDAFSSFVDQESYFKGQFSVEVVRGCPNRCRFCLLGFFKLPPRFLPGQAVLDLLSQLPANTVKQVGLVGSAVAEHPDIKEILLKAPTHLILNPSSVNANALDREMVELLAARGAKTLTIAPEVAREQLRVRLNKPSTNEKIFQVVQWARDAGFGSVKLYYMFGLPQETDQDITAISQQIQEIKRVFKKRVRATVSPFVPKAQTPMAFARFLSQQEYRHKRSLLQVPKDVHLKVHGYRQARNETILSRGDKMVSAALMHAAQTGSGLISALKAVRGIASLYLDDPGYTSRAPFRNIITGLDPGFLAREMTNYTRARLSPGCVPDRCRMCGLCGKLFPKDHQTR